MNDKRLLLHGVGFELFFMAMVCLSTTLNNKIYFSWLQFLLSFKITKCVALFPLHHRLFKQFLKTISYTQNYISLGSSIIHANFAIETKFKF